MEIEIKPLSPKLLNDFLHFFDNIGFTDNPDWSGCYCRYFHFNGTPEEWGNAGKEENRGCSIDLINSGNLKGYIAYSENKPVGWCNANLKKEFVMLKRKEELLSHEDEKIVSVVCFVIAPGFRKKGIANALLNRVIEDYSGTGIQYIEAYPKIGADSDAHNFMGPVSLYEKLGFVKLKTVGSIQMMKKKVYQDSPKNEQKN